MRVTQKRTTLANKSRHGPGAKESRCEVPGVFLAFDKRFLAKPALGELASVAHAAEKADLA